MTTIGLIGGTGKQGYGLAKQWAKAGYGIIIGSRNTEKGQKIAKDLQHEMESNTEISGGDNILATTADIVVLSIPVDQIDNLIIPLTKFLENKIIIDVIVNLQFGKFIKTNLIDGLSTHEYLCKILPTSKIVSCFKTIPYSLLNANEVINQIDFQISESEEAINISHELASKIGLTPVKVEGKMHAHTIERMTALAIQLNKSYPGSHIGYLLNGLKQ